MTRYEEGIQQIEVSCGGGKDNVIAVATIAIEPACDGKPYPCVREVDAFYEDGVFYITTTASSNKVLQAVNNNHAAFSVSSEGITGSAVAENLGWVLEPRNAAIRDKLRKAFSGWYDHANNEQDKDCAILALRITKAFVFKDHGAVRYILDLENKTEIIE
ncbi:MAG: pyridoxamine 5'-phosphate oxidase family protein [Oscillospiraceae bacterium]|jgi:hypothetical protein|nr:pyridoxamine 5'-phosphate oxidase family protein [Oscillospiraceae bacterium]